ncbi:acyltransferase family protein [Mitsuaria sp. GD03876]|uniref:acyltransferase family protein n=1 Tax=Mitsuaria sp. GD03876 TaxID=2975399 RepID=UPI00244C8BEC|nr:acyltransferase family protein [Mitsuaria sp. GD03876]MDH0865355.1 acyltransferase family protein [Mitsuaria sp. GD03876]
MNVPIPPPAQAAGPGVAGAPGMAPDLDRVRATLMVLGIALHAADVFITAGDWLVADPHRSVVFDALVALIHSFRVPGFFLLSGLFFAGSLGRHGAPELLMRQLLRLGLPLLTCWALLNGAQQALLAWHRGGDPWEAVFSTPAPIYHLWFLRDLLILDLLVLAWIAIAGRGARASGASGASGAPGRLTRVSARAWAWAWLSTRLGSHGPSHWLTVALCGALLSHALLIAIRLTGWAYVKGLGGLTLYNLAFYAPLFLAGMAMAHRPAWLDAWLRTPAWLLPMAAFAASWGDGASDTLTGALAREAALAVQLLGIWIATGAAVGGLGRLRRGGPRSVMGRALSDASYTIFLVHHLLVVALALALLPRDWPASVKFCLIVVGTLALSLAFHRWVVRPFAAMRLLFNGRGPAPSASHDTAAAPGRA